jgi:chromate reductase
LSVPVELNNAIDWAARPSGVDSFNGKPVAIVSASIGILRGARAQYHLSQFFVFQNMHPVNAPEVIVTFAKDMFDANGALVDNTKVSRELLQNLVDWIDKLRQVLCIEYHLIFRAF